MNTNICSGTDKIIRVILGLAILGAGWFYQSLWGLVGLYPLATAALSWCAFYSLFGVDTCHMKGHSH